MGNGLNKRNSNQNRRKSNRIAQCRGYLPGVFFKSLCEVCGLIKTQAVTYLADAPVRVQQQGARLLHNAIGYQLACGFACYRF